MMMEATGPYHEALAHALHDAGLVVSVINPKAVKDFAKGLGIKAKNTIAPQRSCANQAIAMSPKARPKVVLTRRNTPFRREAPVVSRLIKMIASTPYLGRSQFIENASQYINTMLKASLKASLSCVARSIKAPRSPLIRKGRREAGGHCRQRAGPVRVRPAIAQPRQERWHVYTLH